MLEPLKSYNHKWCEVGDESPISCAFVTSCEDLRGLQKELTQLLRNEWVDHVNRKDYSGGWDVLPLRCQHEHINAHPILQGFAISSADGWQDLPILEACPAMHTFLKSMQCPLKSVRLMRLQAGAVIKPHRDQGLSLEHGEARLHLPLQTSERIRFVVNGQDVPMKAGELWYINADQEHSVQNFSDEDRINLVIDCEANKWLKNAITQPSLVS
ncbi:MAG: aspartyl/asparaginyl beta-hydroxylase domain-containing protein [Cellvibrionaceae bacterium]|nr:aspartyl/asparaginyl beta-hydroxylase domain-containing protein [Cellvibrionaceae bacterium]